MSNSSAGATDEIDIGKLFQRIGLWFKARGFAFVRFLALMRRIPLENKPSFIGITAVSVVVALIYGILLKKDYFESTMILSSYYLNKRLVDNAIENLDLLAKEEESAGLAKALKISDALAENLLRFEAQPFVSEEEILALELLKERMKNGGEDINHALIDNVVDQLQIENRHSFEITVRALSSPVIVDLQDAIVNYFRSNQFVQRRIEITQKNLEARRDKLIRDLEKMDSLKEIIYTNYKSMAEKSRDGSNNVILSDRTLTDPVQIFNADRGLYGDLQAVNKELYLAPDFEIVDGFTEFTEPASPSILKLVVLSIFLGIVIAYLDVAVRHVNNYLAELK